MKTALLFLLAHIPLFAANHGQEFAVRLDVGATHFTVNNSGPAGGAVERKVGVPAAWARAAVVVSTIFTPPTSAITLTTCADPCGVGGTASLTTLNMQWGQLYVWLIRLDSGGSIVSPFTVSAAAGAYKTNTCDGFGTIPQIPFSTITTAPLPMPIEVIGQDCYVTRVQLPLISGHASTSLRLYIRIHNPGYTSAVRPDGKISFQIDGGSWIALTNANATGIDEMKYYGDIGSYARVREFTLVVPDGTVGSSDTTVTIGIRFNGTEGNTSGARILALNLIEANKTCTQISVTSNVATPTCSSNGYSSGDTVLMQFTPGMYMRFGGLRTLTAAATNTFDFTPCGTTVTSTSGCTSPNGTYTVPVNRNTIVTTGYMTQPVIAAARGIIANSAFTAAAMPSAAPGGSDAVAGGNLWLYGNAAGTPNVAAMVNPQAPYVNNVLSTITTCAACHTKQGKDLKVYNFSNNAIRERAKFHGMTDQEGDNIAAFIRAAAVPVPINGRPWNPPLQPGPGMSVGTFNKSNGTLTQLVTSSNVTTATFSADPGFVTGDAIIVWGATVDTDLNNDYAITGGSGTTRTFTTVNVANGTYTESTLGISNTVKFFAGAGIDAVLTYGMDTWEYMDNTKFAFDSKLDPRNVPIPWQFGDWLQWIPVCYPSDCFPSLNFGASTALTRVNDVIDNMAPNSYSAFSAKQFGDIYNRGDNWLDATLQASGFTGNGSVTLAGQRPPAVWPMNSFSIQLLATVKSWEIAVEKQTFQFDGQRQAAAHGTSATPNPNWSVSNGVLAPGPFFSTGMHRIGLHTGLYNIATSSPTDPDYCTFDYQSNIWYHLQVIANGGNGWGNGTLIDNGYYLAFLNAVSKDCRPTGPPSLLFAGIFATQASALNANWFFHNGSIGIDWTGLLSSAGSQASTPDYWFMTATEWRDRIANSFLAMFTANFVNTQNAAYWTNVFTNYSADPCCFAANGWSGTGGGGDRLAYWITVLNTWDADSTQRAAFLAWLKLVYPAHDWDADVAAGVEGDVANGATGTLDGAGIKTVTFTTCPASVSTGGQGSYFNRPFWVNSTGGEEPELVYTAFSEPGQTCVKGSAGTLKFNLARAHTGTLKVSLGCSKTVNPFPNYRFQGFAGGNFRCSNMFPDSP